MKLAAQSCRVGPGFVLTEAARSVLRRECDRDGPQAVVLSWPSGVTYLPERQFRPGDHDVVLERGTGFCVYTDSRALALFLDRRVVVDVGAGRRGSRRPPLRARSVPDEHACDARCPQLPGPDAYRPELNAAALMLVNELRRYFGDLVTESVLWSYVRSALAELTDAGPVESLMAPALRLVRQRLQDVPVGAARAAAL